ncbi:Uncharacterised protein [Mycobacteroides abscessus subsp. abscessus]|nr:Uncharacterised protein [Mycobacteroides abscessus subsp. abscessus]
MPSGTSPDCRSTGCASVGIPLVPRLLTELTAPAPWLVSCATCPTPSVPFDTVSLSWVNCSA